MSKRAKIRIVCYLSALVAALGLRAWARGADLADARRAADYSAQRAFEETVVSVDGLAQSLAKSVYATDGSMCVRICGEAYAHALAAETAMSTLPFSTQELEQISAFLNVAGDYAYTLCGEAVLDGFSAEQLETLTTLSGAAATLAESLRELQGGVHGGDVVMDRAQLRLENLTPDDGTEQLSARFLRCESLFDGPDAPEYDGKFGCSEKESRGYLTEQAMLELAAEYAGVPPAALKEEYAYEGSNGRRCFRTGDLFLCASRAGVESMAQSRLVGEALLDEEKARAIAEEYLYERGFRDLELTDSERRGAVASMVYSRTENGAVCLDNCVQIAVALDDGSIYSFNAACYSGEESGARFRVDEESARQALPESLELLESRKVIIKSPGMRDLACYEFSCQSEDGRAVTVYVDAATGKQSRIDL